MSIMSRKTLLLTCTGLIISPASFSSALSQEAIQEAQTAREAFLPIFRKERQYNKESDIISWGGQFKAFPLASYNRDLIGDKSLDQSFIPLRLEAGLAVQLTPKSDLYFSVEARDKVFLEGEGSDPTEFLLENARLNLHDLGIKGLSLHVGRMTIQDHREAILRAQFDGALVAYQNQQVRVDFGVFSRGKLRTDLLHSGPNTESIDIIARLEKRLTEALIVGALYINLDNKTSVDDDRSYYAIRSHGQLWKGLQHWAEVTHLSGASSSHKRSAWAAEIRGLQSTHLPGKAQIGLSYIWASGDDNPFDDKDTTFRQTGLQRNNSFWSKGPKYRLLGEALRAEVSNIHALTAIMRFFPNKSSSIALLYHNFWQDTASTVQAGWRWGGSPNGINRKLATEIDLNAAYKFKNGTALEVNAAYLKPGAAFGTNRSSGFAYGLEIRHPL